MLIASSAIMSSCEDDSSKAAVTTAATTASEYNPSSATTTQATTIATTPIPAGYTLYNDVISFVYPSSWTKTTGSQVMLQDASTGNNINIIYEEYTNVYENMSESYALELLGPFYEAIGSTVNELEMTRKKTNGLDVTEICILSYSNTMSVSMYQTQYIFRVDQYNYIVTITEMVSDTEMIQNVFNSLKLASK